MYTCKGPDLRVVAAHLAIVLGGGDRANLVHAQLRYWIDHAWVQVLPGQIYHVGSSRNRHLRGRAHGSDPTVRDHDRSIVDFAARHGVNGGAGQRGHRLLQQATAAASGETVPPDQTARGLIRRGHVRHQSDLRQFLECFQPCLLLTLQVVVDYAVDDGFFHACVRIERITGQQHDVGVLAHFEGAHLVVYHDLPRGIDREHAERVLFGHAAVLHYLVELVHHKRLQPRYVRVDAGQHAVFFHDGRVVGDCVIGFEFVLPPVGEGPASGSVLGHLVGDLVTLQDVGEHVDLEPELLGHTHEHHDFIAPVRVGDDSDSALHDFNQGL